MSLSSEIRDTHSPVTRWLRHTLSLHHAVQRAYRQAAGPILAPAPPGGVSATVGAAIDLWIRLLCDPAPNLRIAFLGTMTGQAAPYGRAGLALLDHLSAVGRAPLRPRPADPSRWAGRDDEWMARCAFALALLVEPLRAGPVHGSPLHTLPGDAHLGDLLALAPPAAVTDLIALRDLAAPRLFPELAGKRIVTGPTFAGSATIGGADADLIAGGLLLDLKAAQGKPCPDGARMLTLDRTDLDQLLGYTLLDYHDEFHIDRLGLYAVRYGQLTTWGLQELLTELAGHPVRLIDLRREFRAILDTELPAYRPGLRA